MHLKLMYVANDPNVVLIAQKYGVDRIWIDLEKNGKEERQKNMNTLKSYHTIEDVEKIAKLLTTSDLLVRINPWNENSKDEINAVLDAGAQIVMLPMWKTAIEVDCFLKCVKHRAKTLLLLETKQAVECLEQVLLMNGIDEIHIGLNDLHLSYGMRFMFEPLANGMVQDICNMIRLANIPYGFGGVTKLGFGLLPSENVLMEHYRLKSSMAILARSFCRLDEYESYELFENDFAYNMSMLRQFEQKIEHVDEKEIMKNYYEVKKRVQDIILQK